jgi:hypothetical protein
MAGIEAFLKGWVSRMLPQAEQDNDPGIVRLGRFGDVWTIGAVRKQHALADEGSYFVTTSNQTTIVGPLLPTAFSNINPSVVMIVSNSDTPGNQNNKRLHLDWCHFVVTAAGVAGAGLTLCNFAWTIDVGDRYVSGGTDLSANVVCPNGDTPSRASIAKVRAGAITIAAATGAVRTVVGQRQFRQQNSGIAMGVAQDHMYMNFGPVEAPFDAQVDLSTAKTSAGRFLYALPPIVFGPGQCALLHMWSPGAALTTGISMLHEMGWWER